MKEFWEVIDNHLWAVFIVLVLAIAGINATFEGLVKVIREWKRDAR